RLTVRLGGVGDGEVTSTLGQDGVRRTLPPRALPYAGCGPRRADPPVKRRPGAAAAGSGKRPRRSGPGDARRLAAACGSTPRHRQDQRAISGTGAESAATARSARLFLLPGTV